LEDHLTNKEIQERYGIRTATVSLSKKVYYPIYKEQMKRVEFENRSKAHENRMPESYSGHPSVILDKEDLERKIIDGKQNGYRGGICVAPQTVYKNLRRYKLRIPNRKLQSMRSKDWEQLQRLEILTPGIVELAHQYDKRTYDFYQALYLAYCNLLKLTWFVKKIASRHSYYRDSGKFQKTIYAGIQIMRRLYYLLRS
jgi:hypothetical protein